MRRCLTLLALASLVLASASPAAAETGCIEGDCQNGVGTWKFGEVETYVGSWRDGLREGRGVETTSIGLNYDGEWKGGKEHGSGTQTWPDGGKYVGEWQDAKYHGEGKRTWPSGQSYQGGWRLGKYHGEGTFVFANDMVYRGAWLDGKKHSDGTLTWPSGARYKGEWYNDSKHGQGKMIWPDSHAYEGEWSRDKESGQGTLTYDNGRKYVGAFHLGKPEGEGVETFPNGRRYEGPFHRGKWHGEGKETLANGGVYLGGFEKGRRHGAGTLTSADGSVKKGPWKRGKFEGSPAQKTASAKPGQSVQRSATPAPARIPPKPTPPPAAIERRPATGCIAGTCREGMGTYAWKDGNRYEGEWRKGRPHGSGTLIYPAGGSYAGEWRDAKRWGSGTEIHVDGRVQTGRWEANRFLGDPEARPRRAQAQARSRRLPWPSLSNPAPAIGGGAKDAALVVAIESYAEVARIPGALENGSAWFDYLVETRRVPLDKVAVLSNDDATIEELRRAVVQTARRVEKGGTLWFVFVGHGAPSRDGKDGLLVGYDAQQKARSIQARSLPRRELLARLEKSRAGKIQVFLDACFSGRSGTGEQLVAGLQPLVVSSTAATRDRRTMLFTAARANEFAGPLPGAARPAFSYLALGALRGWADRDGNGVVTAGELHRYVSRAMQSLVKDRSQRPELVGESRAPLGRSARERAPDLAGLVRQSTLSR